METVRELKDKNKRMSEDVAQMNQSMAQINVMKIRNQRLTILENWKLTKNGEKGNSMLLNQIGNIEKRFYTISACQYSA